MSLADNAFAYLYTLDAHERIDQHITLNGLKFRKIIRPKGRPHSLFFVELMSLGMGVSDRIMGTWFTWRKEADGTFFLAFSPYTDYDDPTEVGAIKLLIQQDPSATRAVVATTRGIWCITPKAPNVCSITLLGQGNLGGHIPQAVVTLRMKQTLSLVQTLQTKCVRRGRTVDAELRLAQPPPPLTAQLSPDQLAILTSCRSLEGGDAAPLNKSISGMTRVARILTRDLAGPRAEVAWAPLKFLGSPFVTMFIKFTPPKNKGERCVATGKAVTVVDCR